jgi:hypothetical protein
LQFRYRGSRRESAVAQLSTLAVEPCAKMPPEYIEYFRALVEQRPSAERWHIWWEAHQSDVERLLTRGVYLRLTYEPVQEIFAILEAAGFSYAMTLPYRNPKFHRPDPIPAAWLVSRSSMTEVETARNPIDLQGALAAIKEDLQKEDEVWTFCSPEETWATLMGCQGFAFVRNGVPYDHIVTLRN